MKKIIALLLMQSICICAFAQSTAFKRYTSIPLMQFGTNMPLAWAGGINGGMFSEVDMNGDGIKDLFVFEKDQAYKKARFSTYINVGTPNQVNYVYAPEYESHFPQEIADWAILVDYNHDGKEDLFTYSNKIPAAGITVYKNVSVGGNLQFQLEYPLLTDIVPSGIGNVYVTSADKPALVDFDGDGDLDEVAVYVGGGRLEWNKNIAMETLGRNDTLVFEWQQNCWGHFVFSGATNSAFLNVACKPAPIVALPPDSANQNPPPNPTDAARHNGTCLVIHDFNNDSLVDYLGGDANGSNLLYLQNGGTMADPNMMTQDTVFPVYNNSANIFEFLDPSLVDVNNDGKLDLLVSPCKNGNAENHESVWYYRNIGVAGVDSFTYSTSSFLINQMADVGEGAKVSFFDADADGLMDILVGNQGYYNGFINIGGINYSQFQSGIAFFKNTGTASAPAFALQTIDWMNLFSIGINAIHPTFGDLDGDGDDDMIVGEETGKLYYFENTGGAGNPADFSTPPIAYYNSIDVGKYAAPQLIDMNKDGLLDLVVGNELGKIYYYNNIGTATSPFFSLANMNFGGVNVTQGLGVTGRASPFFYHDINGNTKLLVGCEHGNVFYYDNIDGNLAGSFTLVDTNYKDIHEPVKATIAGYDINNDGLMDLLIGNQAGGFIIYKQVINTGVNELAINDDNAFTLYPVPARNELTIKLNDNVSFTNLAVTVFDNTGKVIYKKPMTDYYTIVDLSNYSSGIYFCKITDMQTGTYTDKKFIVSK